MRTTFLDGEPVVASFPKDKSLWLTYGGAWRLNGEYAWFGGTKYNGGNPLDIMGTILFKPYQDLGEGLFFDN